MKTRLLLLAFFTSLILFSCKSDSVPAEEVTEEDVEKVAEDLIAEQLAQAEAEAAALAEEETVANEVEVEMDEVNVDQAAKIEEKKEILKEQLKESPNLGKDCESLLKEYGELVDQYVKGENQDAVLAQLAKWSNDVIFNKCRKNPDYADKFYELEDRMYADEDEDL